MGNWREKKFLEIRDGSRLSTFFLCKRGLDHRMVGICIKGIFVNILAWFWLICKQWFCTLCRKLDKRARSDGKDTKTLGEFFFMSPAREHFQSAYLHHQHYCYASAFHRTSFLSSCHFARKILLFKPIDHLLSPHRQDLMWNCSSWGPVTTSLGNPSFYKLNRST